MTDREQLRLLAEAVGEFVRCVATPADQIADGESFCVTLSTDDHYEKVQAALSRAEKHLAALRN